jgi:hypothetical protein
MRVTSLISAFFGVPIVLAALPGCGSATTNGALDQSSITQGCAGSTLPCGSTSALTGPIAVGTSVTLSVDLALGGADQPPLQLVSSEPSILSVHGETVTGVAQGLSTLLLTTVEDVVIDFDAIWVQQPVALTLSSLSADGTNLGELSGNLGLVVGDDASVAVSTSSYFQPLLGTPETKWTVADPTIVSVVDGGVLGVANVVARAAGTTKVTASALGLDASFIVAVTP